MAGGKEKEAENAAEGYSEPASSKNRNAKALKTKAKIVKKSQQNNLIKMSKFKGSPQVQGKKGKKKKRVPEGSKERSNTEREDEKKLNSSGMKQKSIASNAFDDKSQQHQKTEGKLGGFQKKKQNQKNNEKHSGFENHKSHMNKEKHAELEENRHKEKRKEKLGGLIFMCNAKTKPDCFRCRVMGVPISKKDLVMGIKPGLKLFLYDFDLKLMYGIYKASSSGGLKLEPTAFDGAFPVQVRFIVHRDCYPLPESVFKKAIKENYNGRSKFDTELSVKQVRKLIELFRPAEVQSKTPAIHPQPMVAIQNREVFDRARESWLHSYQEPSARGPYTYEEVRRYSVLPNENGRHLPYTEVPSTEKEEFPLDTFLSEKEYRTYGLRGKRPNLTPPTSHIAPALEPYATDHVREHIPRYPQSMHTDIAHPSGELIHHGPLLLNEREYRTYGIGARQELLYSIPSVTATAASPLDSYLKHQHYLSHYGASTVDPYPPPPPSRRDEVPLGSYSIGGSRETYPTEADHLPRRETYLTEADHLNRRGGYLTGSEFSRRRETVGVERLYSTDASSALSDYNRTHYYQGTMPEPASRSASSRYSLAGPSLSYR